MIVPHTEQYTDMFEPAQETKEQLRSRELLAFYDEFSEFNDYCAFLCDAFASVATVERELDDASAQGLKRSAQWMKERMEYLKTELKVIQENAAIQQ